MNPVDENFRLTDSNDRIGQPLISELHIQQRTSQLAKQIASDFRNKEIVVVIVLKGAFVFASDLLRRLNNAELRPLVDFVRASSYGSGTDSGGSVEFSLDVSIPLEGRDVLLIDDIADSGGTLTLLRDRLYSRGACSVKCCVLLDKPSRRKVEFQPDYVGFEIPDRFVVGYGLDFDERFRCLPYIIKLENIEGSPE